MLQLKELEEEVKAASKAVIAVQEDFNDASRALDSHRPESSAASVSTSGDEKVVMQRSAILDLQSQLSDPEVLDTRYRAYVSSLENPMAAMSPAGWMVQVLSRQINPLLQSMEASDVSGSSYSERARKAAKTGHTAVRGGAKLVEYAVVHHGMVMLGR